MPDSMPGIEGIGHRGPASRPGIEGHRGPTRVGLARNWNQLGTPSRGLCMRWGQLSSRRRRICKGWGPAGLACPWDSQGDWPQLAWTSAGTGDPEAGEEGYHH